MEARSTPAQMVYINDLYDKLEIGYREREIPATKYIASLLIDDLKRRLEKNDSI